MLTEDEIFLAIDNVPITQKYVVGVGRAIERAVLAKLAAARMHEQNGGSVQPYVQAGATDAEPFAEVDAMVARVRELRGDRPFDEVRQAFNAAADRLEVLASKLAHGTRSAAEWRAST